MSPNIGVGRNTEAGPTGEIKPQPEIPQEGAPEIIVEEVKKQETIEKPVQTPQTPQAAENYVESYPTEEKITPLPLTTGNISQEVLDNSQAARMTEAVNESSGQS